MSNIVINLYKKFLNSIDSRGWHYEAKIDWNGEYKAGTRKCPRLTKEEKKKVYDVFKPYNIKKRQIKLAYYELYKTLKNDFDPLYMPHTLFFRYIDKKFNFDKRIVMDEKAYYSLLFNNDSLKQDRDRNLEKLDFLLCIDGEFKDLQYNTLDEETAIKMIKDYLKSDGLIIKKSLGSSGGKGIHFLDKDASIDKIKEALRASKNYVIQRLITQHDSLASLHKESINTIRVMTMILNDKVHILSTVCRIGRDKLRVDNASSGGICVGVNIDGTLKDFAYSTKEIKIYKNFPDKDNPYAFKDMSLPKEGIAKIHEICATLAYRVPFCKLVSWDFSLDQNSKPIFVEANLFRGSIVLHQMCNGPIFKDLTDEVLTYCFGKKKGR